MAPLDPERRELWLQIVETVNAIDRLFARLSDRITAIIRARPTGITLREARPSLMRQIDRVLHAAFGLTQRAAMTSELFATILRATDAVAEQPFRRALEFVQQAVERRNPLLWQTIRARLLAGGTGPQDGFSVMVQAIEGPSAIRQRYLRSGLLDPQRKWLPKSQWNTKTGYTLSDRLWRHGKIVRKNIENTIRDAIRTGESPIVLGRRLEQYLNPAFAPTVYRKNGTIVRRHVTGIPAGAGYASSYARTLARTELSRVYNQATVQAARITPGVIGIRYALSNSHTDGDSCDELAHSDRYDLGDGVYPVDQFPAPPQHPNCLCGSQIVTVDREDFIDQLVEKYA